MKTALFAVFLALVFAAQPSAPAAIYVAPYGGSTAAGDSDSPRSLASVLCAGCVSPGSTVYLLPGRYVGPFVSQVSGTQASPITLRSVPGTRAKLDGKLDILGQWTTWKDLEITYTGWTTRTSQYSGSQPPDMARTDLYITGKGTRIERTYIHDIADVGWWQPATDSAFVDVLVYSVGHQGKPPDRGHGHGLYTQNWGSGGKLIQNVVSSGNYSTCGKIYGVTAALKNYTVDGLVCAPSQDPRFLVGGETGTADDITIKNSLFYGTQLSVGNRAPITPTGTISITDNIIVHRLGTPFVATYWRDLLFSRNLVIGGAASDPAQRYVITTVSPRSSWQFTDNQYHFLGAGPQVVKNEGVAFYTWPQWQAQGRDTTSGIAYTQPTTNTILVRATSPHRGIVVMYNWLNLSSVALDLSTLNLTPGAAYRLVNAQNPAQALPFVAGGAVSFPTGGWTVATPIGAVAPLVSFDNRFLVFLVEPCSYSC